MTPRVLLVSPHFPPVNAPDMQRARHAVCHLRAAGWEAEVLAVDPRDVAVAQDPLLLATLPPDLPVHRIRALPLSLSLLVGSSSLGPRSRFLLGRAGDRLLRARRFDLVFFSTTQFNVLTLGPRWRRDHGVPFVVDWQDPWVTDYYERPGAPRPPGGWKYRFAAAQARRQEGPTLRAAAGVVSVSEEYLQQLRARHPWFDTLPSTVIPFGFETADLPVARQAGVTPAFTRQPGTRHVAFVGAAGPIMRPALEFLFAGIRDWVDAEPGRREGLRLHFHGTSYAPAGQAEPSVQPLAEAAGVGDLVRESPGRLGHFVALRTLLEADVVLLLGSEATGYVPSKLATLAGTGRPVLAVVPADGPLARHLQTAGAAVHVVGYGPRASPRAVGQYLDAIPQPPAAAAPDLARLSALGRTRELASFFDRVLAASTR